MSNKLLEHLRTRYHHTNIQDRVDQVVAMIFRTTPNDNTELLFLQRAYSEDDHYSGDVCFPGGYREEGEACLTAALRETQEETGLKLTSSNYMGCLEFTFTTRVAKSRVRGNGKDPIQLYMGILMFEIDMPTSVTIKLSQKQIRSYKWVNIAHFFQGDPNLLTTWNHPYKVKPNQQLLIYFPAYFIGMDRQLYGLTLYTMMLFVLTVRQLMESNPGLRVKMSEEFWERFQFHCTDLRVEGGDQDLKLAKKLYLENRVGFLKPKL